MSQRFGPPVTADRAHTLHRGPREIGSSMGHRRPSTGGTSRKGECRKVDLHRIFSAQSSHLPHPPVLRPLKAPVSILTDLTDLIASRLDPPSRQKKKYEILDILANEPRPPFQRSKAGPLGRPKFPRRHQRRESQSSGRRAARPTFVPRRSNQRTWRETFFLEQEKSALSDWGLSSFFQARLPFGRRSFLGLARDIHEVVEPVMEGSCEMRRGNNHGHEVHNSPIVGQQNSPSATRFFLSLS